MPVLMILVAVAILVGVFFVATGRGGELAYAQPDHAPLDLGAVSATDVALLRPPTALWGYNIQVTDEALEKIAQAVRDRDVTIAFLQQRLADLTTHPADLTTHPADLTAHPADLTAHPADLTAHPADLTAHPADLTAGLSDPAGPADDPEPAAGLPGPDDHAGAEQSW